MAENRAKARDLIIPDVRDLARRAACEADDALWLRTYCQDVFYNPFTAYQLKVIADCGESLSIDWSTCDAGAAQVPSGATGEACPAEALPGDGFIVGTSFKRDAKVENPVDEQRVRQFIAAIQ